MADVVRLFRRVNCDLNGIEAAVAEYADDENERRFFCKQNSIDYVPALNRHLIPEQVYYQASNPALDRLFTKMMESWSRHLYRWPDELKYLPGLPLKMLEEIKWAERLGIFTWIDLFRNCDKNENFVIAVGIRDGHYYPIAYWGNETYANKFQAMLLPKPTQDQASENTAIYRVMGAAIIGVIIGSLLSLIVSRIIMKIY